MKHLAALKRVVSVVLVVCMLVGILSTSVFADSNSRIVRARKINGISRSVNMKSQAEKVNENVSLYNDDDIVTVIVQLESPAVIDYYNGGVSTFSTMGAITGSVSEFLTSSAADMIEDELLYEQQSVINAIAAIPAAGFSYQPVEVLMQYTGIVNAMAIRVPYGKLAEIKKLDGVKRAYVEHTYSAPEPVSNVELGIEGYSYSMVGVTGAWNEGYTGTGTVVAILDTGLDLSHQAFTADSFMRANPTADVKFDEAGMAAHLNEVSDDMMAPKILMSGSMSDTYKNLKVPYAFDYAALLNQAAGDTDVFPGLGGSAHGTHVAGTVAGYAVTDEGAVEFSGIAPDAQLMILKVFDDQGSMSSEMMLLCALNDAIVLGADVINLSLGSDNGFAEDDSLEPDLFRAIEAAGVTAMVASGNSGHSDYNSTGRNVGLNGYGNLTTNPEMSMMSSPAVYDSNIAVASINNVIEYASMLIVDGMGMKFSESTGDIIWSDVMGDIEDSIPIYLVEGVGSEEDYAASAFANGAKGIALVQRGEIAFAEKVINAQAYDGVIGVIIYDNTLGTLTTRMDFTGYDVKLPAVLITLADGSAIANAIKAGDQPVYDGIFEGFIDWEDDDGSQGVGGEMSYFSSWGAGPALELKPDITAPGGNILSSVFSGEYDVYSGTSMATPHMAGLGALVAQYVKQDLGYTGNAASTLAEHLLVSTAVPQYDVNYDSFYSPRQQGAGLADVSAAISTPAFVAVDGANVGKLELGDDVNWTGTFDYSFNVVNMSSETLTYEATVYYQIPYFGNLGGEIIMLSADMLVGWDDPITVSVAPNSTKTVTGTIDASDLVADIASFFPNGTYLEGFIILEDVNGVNPNLSVPYLGFVGDWTEAPIFDSATWYNILDADGYPTDAYYNAFWGITTIGCPIDDQYVMIPGTNPYYGNDANYGIYFTENFTLSPNGDDYFDYIGYYDIYQLRDARLIILEAYDKETGEVYYHDWMSCMHKTTFNTSYQTVFPYSWYLGGGWDGTDMDGNLLPSGTQVVYTITAYGDGEYDWAYDEDYGWYVDGDAVDPNDPSTEPTFNGHAMNKTGDVISFDLLIDYAEPELKNDGEVIVESFGEDGLYIAEGTFDDDNGSIAGIEAYVAYTDESGNILDIDYYNPIDYIAVFDPDIHEYSFNIIIDSTEYADWNGDVVLACVDYGANESLWIFNVFENADEELIMFVGEDGSLLAELAPYLEWTSSDESVITVDENGNIVAVGAGTATVTGTDPDTGDEITYSITVIGAVADDTTKGGNAVTGEGNNVTLAAGETDTLIVVLTSSLVDVDDFVWTSSDDSVVTVDADGNINAVSVGTATVTATSASHPGLTVTFTITVNEPLLPPSSHGHSHVFGPWSFDANGHWRTCFGCGIRIDIGAHIADESGICIFCGYVANANAGDGGVVVDTPTQDTDNIDDEPDNSSDIEVNDTVENNPKTGVAFSAFALAMAAAAVVSTKRK